MKKKTKIRLTLFGSLLFVAVNIFLVWFDEKELTRLSYIEEWEQTFEEDLYNEIENEGTFQSSTVEYSYFDKQAGSFKQFLVEEGDQVDVGDDLYEYVVRDYQADKQQLESQEDKLEGEIDALEDYVDAVEDTDIPEPEEDERPYVDAELSKAQREAQANMMLEKKEAQLDVIEDQLDTLSDNGQVIQVGSQYEGTITDISETLDNPAITIKQDELVVAGKVHEGERNEIQEGMKVRGNLLNQNQTWEGALESVASYSEYEKDDTSYYNYTIELNEQPEGALQGYHTTVSFITGEAQNSLTAEIGWIQERLEEVKPEEPAEETDTEAEDNSTDESETPDQPSEEEGPAAFERQRFLWVMTSDGTTLTRPIETGLVMGDLVQITDGVGLGQWVADENESQFFDGGTFLTPINRDHLTLDSIQAQENWWSAMKMGVLVR
ncbi:efflux RND transporter periplasmic adaptor subunit [Pontibacillus yanchengensis]|uniref:HlyD family secretion protein n=1 Tax=Pontibacillus yanchengensis Y32 TaxID=1385514 RepID=A0A0A2T7G8_9BACI|nr:efflux RND transporter periplasmic adaptor subunit [Pontibacillus yanchengensis]KGP71752.1 hypothetical protein N782_16770 [Pontibacillus yanchengensis Y32]